MIRNNFKQNRGYTLLFAVLITSIVLSVAISILSISRKEFALSTAARESSFAFYAADSGIECAVYYDNQNIFGTRDITATPVTAPIDCSGQSGIPLTAIGSTESWPPTTAPYINEYSFDLLTDNSSPTGSCAHVTIEKEFKLDINSNLISTTTITSNGFNAGWKSGLCGEPGPRRVQRTLQLSR